MLLGNVCISRTIELCIKQYRHTYICYSMYVHMYVHTYIHTYMLLLFMLLSYTCIADVNVYISAKTFNVNDDYVA